jgi:hypothetical protein
MEVIAPDGQSIQTSSALTGQGGTGLKLQDSEGYA